VRWPDEDELVVLFAPAATGDVRPVPTECSFQPPDLSKFGKLDFQSCPVPRGYVMADATRTAAVHKVNDEQLGSDAGRVRMLLDDQQPAPEPIHFLNEPSYFLSLLCWPPLYRVTRFKLRRAHCWRFLATWLGTTRRNSCP